MDRSAVDADEEEARPESLAFDLEHGVETARFSAGHSYEPTPPSVVTEVLTGILADLSAQGTQPAECQFADVGCGKGRVLMLASEVGFGRVLGIELASGLCRAAEENLRTWQATHPDTSEVTVWCGDASRVTWPEEPLIVFLYNPFVEPILDRVLRRLPRTPPVWVVYVNPKYPAPLARYGFERITHTDGPDHYVWSLYRRDGTARP